MAVLLVLQGSNPDIKNHNGRQKAEEWPHTLACQKYIKKKLANGILKEAIAQKHPFSTKNGRCQRLKTNYFLNTFPLITDNNDLFSKFV